MTILSEAGLPLNTKRNFAMAGGGVGRQRMFKSRTIHRSHFVYLPRLLSLRMHMHMKYVFGILLGEFFPFIAGISAKFPVKCQLVNIFCLHAIRSLLELFNSAIGVSVFQ